MAEADKDSVFTLSTEEFVPGCWLGFDCCNELGSTAYFLIVSLIFLKEGSAYCDF
jgi:hypothetical protein